MLLIQLMIKGTAQDAIDALEAHGLRDLTTGDPKGFCLGSHRYALVRIRYSADAARTVAEWSRKFLYFSKPLPVGQTLHYQVGDPWHWYGRNLQFPYVLKTHPME